MSLINLRSPYFIEHTASQTVGSADLTIQINSVDQYVISKDTGSNAVSFEVSELIRDFLDITFDGTMPYSTTTKNSLVVQADLTLDFYANNKVTRASNSAAGTPDTPIGSEQETYTLYGFDGYSYFTEGKNHTLSNGQLLQSATTMYIPENTSAYIPYEDGSSNGVAYHTVSTSDTSVSVGGLTITIERICEPIFNIIQVLFVNKFGAIQEFHFNKKSTIALSTNQESYESMLASANTTYSRYDHQKYVYNKQGNEVITLNTGYIDQGQYETIKQLMLSELVWAKIGSTYFPMNVLTNSTTKRTKTNDRLVNYTIDMEYAYDEINSIR